MLAVLRLARYGCHVWGMRLSRLGAWCGVVGPVLFTAAWVVSSLRQTGHSVAEVQLSGLAADDARVRERASPGALTAGSRSLAGHRGGRGRRRRGCLPARSRIAGRAGLHR